MESICGERDLWGKRRQTANRKSRLQCPQPVLRAELSSPNCSCGPGMMWKTADWHWLTKQWMESHPGCLYPAGHLPVPALGAKLSWWTFLLPRQGREHWGLWGPLLHFPGTKGQLFGTPSQEVIPEVAFSPGAIPTRGFSPHPYSLSATSHHHHPTRVLRNMNKVHVPDSKGLSGLFG